MKNEQTIAHKLEAAAYDIVYLIYGIAYTFWDFLFQPADFRQTGGVARDEGKPVAESRKPYALPITYAAFGFLTLFLYLPAIVGYQPDNFVLLGQALTDRLGFLNSFASAVKGARLPQIVLMLVPIIMVVSIHAAFVRLLLAGMGLKSTFQAQLALDFYASGTGVFLFCIFMSPELIREPIKTFALGADSVGAQAVFLAVVSLIILAFGLTVFRYLTFVHYSCRATRDQWGHIIMATLGATAVSALILWLLVVFWFPFLLPGTPAPA